MISLETISKSNVSTTSKYYLYYCASVGTAMLWWAWYDARNHTDTKEDMHIPVLDVDIKNETAFFVFSIVASVLTVRSLFISWGGWYA